MTESEAISAIQNDLKWHSKELKPAYKEALNMAIKALEEVQEYRKHGTVKGYEKALKSSLENYLLYRAYKEKFTEYEDAEEQGLLLRLPCKVGSTLYQPIIGSHVQEVIAIGLCFDIVRNVWLYEIAFEYNNGEWIKTVCEFAYIGKTVFLTREEAESKLAEMQKG